MKEWLKRLPIGGILLFTTIFLLAFSCASLSKQTVANNESIQEEMPLYVIQKETLTVQIDDIIGPATLKVGDVISELIEAKQLSDKTEFSEIKTLEIVINSPGGNLFVTYRICELMEEAKKYVIVRTIAYEEAFSAAALILSAGTKGERYVRKDSEVMIHDVAIILAKSPLINRKFLDEMRKHYENSEYVKKWYALLSRYTGQTLKRIMKDCYDDTYFTGQEAIDYGLADKIIW